MTRKSRATYEVSGDLTLLNTHSESGSRRWQSERVISSSVDNGHILVEWQTLN
jgi:hypothetical protein